MCNKPLSRRALSRFEFVLCEAMLWQNGGGGNCALSSEHSVCHFRACEVPALGLLLEGSLMSCSCTLYYFLTCLRGRSGLFTKAAKNLRKKETSSNFAATCCLTPLLMLFDVVITCPISILSEQCRGAFRFGAYYVLSRPMEPPTRIAPNEMKSLPLGIVASFTVICCQICHADK